MQSSDDLWTLEDLCTEAGRALACDGPQTDDARVRVVPDVRTLRYYTTLGLIDRPAAMRGRTALYGAKHLCQILAIKRLQSKGQSLEQIQQALLGLSEDELHRLAGLPVSARSTKRERGRADEAFWKRTPAPPTKQASAPATMQGLRLADGVILMVEALRELRDEDREAIRKTATALIDVLRTRGIIGETT